MKNKKMGFLRNFSYVMSSNILSMSVSTIVTFLIPHYISNVTYAYFQLENLYCGYIWLISLGWNDGIYIKYGGIKREELKKEGISGQFLTLFIYIFLISSCILNISGRYSNFDENKKVVFFLSTISVSIEVLSITLKNLLQAVNSMKEYAKVNILDRSLYFVLVLLFLWSGNQDFKILIGIDLLAKFCTLFWAMYISRDFLFVKIKGIKKTLQMAKEAIGIGISINLASYSSKLINNIVQYSIENAFGVIAFGKVALTFSISNMFTKFVAAISIVLFPTLRNVSEEKQVKLYEVLSILLRTILLAAFCCYFPMKSVLSIWLPEYRESLHYVAILLPISLFETKVTMLINTYLKTIRKEKKILVSNLITVVLSVIFSGISVGVCKSLELAVFSIVVILAFRSILEEFMLSRYMEIKRSIWSEIVMTIIFILCSWKLGGILGMVCYILAYIGYLLLNYKKIKEALMYAYKL